MSVSLVAKSYGVMDGEQTSHIGNLLKTKLTQKDIHKVKFGE